MWAFLYAIQLVRKLTISFAIRHSPFAIRHSPFAIRHSPFAIRHSPFAIRHSPLSNVIDAHSTKKTRAPFGLWRFFPIFARLYRLQ